MEAAKAVLLGARLSYLPSLSLNADGGLSSIDGGRPAKTYNLAGSASWEIDLFGKVTNAKRGAQAALEGSRAYEQAVRTQLIATIANSYYTLLMLDRQLAISEQTLDSWEETERTLEALKRAGQANDAAVLQARASRLALEASITTTLQDIRQTENSLSALLASPSRNIERGTLEKQEFPDTLSAGIPVALLANRPDVRQAETNLAQAYYATSAARSAFYPSINLSGSAGWTNNALLNAVGSLVQPLFNRGANIANLRQAKARQEEALLLFRQSLLDAGKEVNDALTRWQSARVRLDYDNGQIAALREAVRKTSLLMRHSSTNYLEGVIDLYHAVGGGCE